MQNEDRIAYILSIADNSLILGQRLGELCGHGPSLETDIALTNISLDLFGQTRSYFQYVAELMGNNKTEDDVAFLRYEREYKNALLVELPNANFAQVILRQYLFDAFHHLLLEKLQFSSDETLAAIAKKSIKEVAYHERFSGDWVLRLGDGTEESREKMQAALDAIWEYTQELFVPTEAEKLAVSTGVGVDVQVLYQPWKTKVEALLTEATLSIPEQSYFQQGGKKGVHTEYMGYLLAEMQYMQRAYPNMKW